MPRCRQRRRRRQENDKRIGNGAEHWKWTKSRRAEPRKSGEASVRQKQKTENVKVETMPTGKVLNNFTHRKRGRSEIERSIRTTETRRHSFIADYAENSKKAKCKRALSLIWSILFHYLLFVSIFLIRTECSSSLYSLYVRLSARLCVVIGDIFARTHSRSRVRQLRVKWKKPQRERHNLAASPSDAPSAAAHSDTDTHGTDLQFDSLPLAASVSLGRSSPCACSGSCPSRVCVCAPRGALSLSASATVCRFQC